MKNCRVVQTLFTMLAAVLLLAQTLTPALAQADPQQEVWNYLQREAQVLTKRQVITNTPLTDVRYSQEALGLLSSREMRIKQADNSNLLTLTKKVQVIPTVQLDKPLQGVKPLRVYVVQFIENDGAGDIRKVAVVRFYPKKGQVWATIINGAGDGYVETDPQQRSLAGRSADKAKEGLDATKEGLKKLNPFGKGKKEKKP